MIEQLMRGVQRMKESVTYQSILAEGAMRGRAEGRVEGRVEGLVEGQLATLQKALVILAQQRFQVDPVEARAAVAEIRSMERLDELFQRACTARSWNEVFPPSE